MDKRVGILIDPDTCDIQTNVIRDSSGKILIGMAIGNALYQNQSFILQAHKGEFKEYPWLGAGISDIIADDDIILWKRDITLQLEADNMHIVKLDLSSSKLIIEADYIE